MNPVQEFWANITAIQQEKSIFLGVDIVDDFKTKSSYTKSL